MLHVERRIVAALRNRTFTSLIELNAAIVQLLEELNSKPFQKLDGSRRSLFEDLDRPALGPLPQERYVYATWRKAKVDIDYHVEVDKVYYSVPYQLVGEVVDVRLTLNTLEILHKGRRVASHIRSYRKGHASTQPDHMPAAHRAHAEWTPSRLIDWGSKVGPNTGAFIKALLEARRHPEQGYRSCLGILRLSRTYPKQRAEAACALERWPTMPSPTEALHPSSRMDSTVSKPKHRRTVPPRSTKTYAAPITMRLRRTSGVNSTDP